MALFGGDTYDPEQDKDRLLTQLGRVRDVMFDGRWHTLGELVERCGGSEASVSARIRDLRKRRFGAYVVESKRVSNGLWAYRLIPPDTTTEATKPVFVSKSRKLEEKEILQIASRHTKYMTGKTAWAMDVVSLIRELEARWNIK
jgi:hypothetical protein